MITVASEGAWAVISLEGDFDVSNADELRQVIAAVVGQAVTDLTLDLSKVTLFAAAGLDALVAANAMVQAAEGRLVLMGTSGLTRRAFEMTGLDLSLPLVAGSVGDRRSSLAHAADSNPVEPRRPVEPQDDPVGAFSEEMFDLGRRLLTGSTVTEDLRRVVETAVEVVPGATAASITILVQGEPRSAIVSDSVAIEVDVAQYISGEGPCLDAAQTAERVRVNVIDAPERFAHFAPLARRAGVEAVLSIPIGLADTTVGSLNVYSDTAFPPAAELPAEIVAAQAGVAIAKGDIYGSARRAAASGQHQLHATQDLNVAQGVLAELQSCTIEHVRQRIPPVNARRRERSVGGWRASSRSASRVAPPAS